ncbi:hypothetical protein [Streptomyces sp. NPDC000134]|uniref:hypothetical protein n=1 Tax=Streptomyces sp. NPDC000134 TaxID=3364536 RepID=UPI00367618D5
MTTALLGTLTAVAAAMAPAGTAVADDDPHSVLAGGLLSRLGSHTADDYSNNCGSLVQIMARTTCVTVDADQHGGGDHRAAPGGVLSDITTSGATDHSNVCGQVVAILSETTCVVRHSHS